MTVVEEDITIISVSPEPEEAADNVKSPMHIIEVHVHTVTHWYSHLYEQEAFNGSTRRERIPGHAHEGGHEGHAYKERRLGGGGQGPCIQERGKRCRKGEVCMQRKEVARGGAAQGSTKQATDPMDSYGSTEEDGNFHTQIKYCS